ncbi:hypothetical protein CANTEDRAFT_112282 [Yamadazyma tenuis ATCC 10573]|nr:uncharacterized protein CANTEDRAFT_112282 [Yamadazyma tenuis ATCC 10573]EGV66823.1 hypothetical protein CANTEDRAFT_112282 [Yamadazyma tenuis ATCC 10573]
MSTNLNLDHKHNRSSLKGKKHYIPSRRRKSRLLTVYDHKSSGSASSDSTPTFKESHYHPKHTANNYIKTSDLKANVSESSNQKLVKLVPEDFVMCNINDLIVLISRMLANLISLNNKLVPNSIINGEDNKKGSLLTRYHSRTPPNISIINYLTRLTKFNNFSNANLLTCIYYIDLLSYNYQPFFTLNSWTVHRFLLIATMISQKSMEDYFFTNEHYAKVGGVALNELNYLEIDFLQRVNWRCIPYKTTTNGQSSIKDSKEVLDLYYRQLIELMGQNCKENEYIYVFENPNVSMEVDRQLPEYITTNDINDNHGDGYSIDKSKFNKNGFSVDSSSSPHLKRRYPNS